MSNLKKIKETIRQTKPFLEEEYGVSKIAIFGSYAKNKQTPASDIDILVEFNRPIGLKYVDLSDQLQKKLGIKTHLVSKRALKNNFKKVIEKDLIYV